MTKLNEQKKQMATKRRGTTQDESRVNWLDSQYVVDGLGRALELSVAINTRLRRLRTQKRYELLDIQLAELNKQINAIFACVARAANVGPEDIAQMVAQHALLGALMA